ncbi:Receptor-like serine/threonine-protein kinase [Raphanus sativus]|uniref:Receptor-like serine/threonine-protein kinase At4g25390 n=1 Tax=Raphanus sativus TaxID=3726 RepID=A0A6J0N268_RAPSA|nr:receptor-like serine/threonine-protein kinase At4g25390 [Raphanus sativus]KAJ4899507.1 Receptor-like serine/threonine-protein kinase [Raphanus sativus]
MPSSRARISPPAPVAPPPSRHHDRTTRTSPPFTVTGVAAGFSLFISLSVCFCKFGRKRPPPPPGDSSSSPRPPREFSYSTLRRATASFSPANRLGQGGFGAVFRGTLSSGENVAVKVMDSGSLQGEAEFQNELFFASKLLDSPHVVPVVGFSHDKKRRRLLLVYKLMDNGNLQDALLHRRCPELMDWSKRFLVAVNVAEGIEHLHGLERPVIHGDIKPSNVLLDKLFSAKIADFGLARVKPEHVEITVAPESNGGGGGGVEEELESVITTATGYEDFNFGRVKQSPEVTGSSPEMGVAPLESPETTATVVSVSPEMGEKAKGREVERKDWWWKQESNAVERGKVKEYVMQWIGSEVKKERPSSVDWIESLAASSSSSSKKLEKKSSKRLEWWLSLEEESENKKKKKKKRRMVREWCKDEYRRELANKKKKKKKTLESEFCSDDVRRRSNSKGSSIDWWLDGLRARGNSHDSVSGEIAKSCGISSTPSMRGTVCYAAPEYCNLDNNNVSEKCDVYSYGVLLLVLVSGRRPLEMTGSASEIQRANLMSWARKLARRGKLVDLVDQKLQNLDQEQAVLCIKVALQCLQRLPVSRPSMKEVLGMLKGEVSLP